MNRKLRSRLTMVFLASLIYFPVTAHVQDYTQDFALPEPPESGESRFVPLMSTWSHFLSQLKGFDRVNPWSLDFGGDKPLLKGDHNLVAPASVQKLVTAASALRNLGRDFQYSNSFEAQINGNTGALLHPKFTVSGDPTWGHEAYEDIRARLLKVLSELKNQNVREVQGPILVNTTHPELDQIPRPQAWPKKWTLQCMATQMTAFMLNGNCGTIRVNSLKEAVWLTPGVDVPITLQLRKASANDLVIIPTLNEQGRIIRYLIRGNFARPTSTFYDPLQDAYLHSVPVHLSTNWLKNLFVQMLNENDISYHAGSATEAFPNGVHTPILVDLSSTPILDALRIAVPQSINGVLDRTFYEIAHHLNAHHPYDPSYQILGENVAATELFEGTVILDGSGLSGMNRMRSDLLYAFLTQVKSRAYFSDFLSTLAVAGESGTLKTRLCGPLTNGKIFAKTGTLDGINNLAGYFQTPDNTFEAFSVLSQSDLSASRVRSLIDKIATEFAYFNTPSAK